MKIFAFAALFAVVTSTYAQTQSSFGFVASKRKTAAVVSLKIGEVIRPAGLKFNLDALTFAGVSDVAVGGFALAGNIPLAQNVGLLLGPGLNFTQGAKPSLCGYFSVSWKF